MSDKTAVLIITTHGEINVKYAVTGVLEPVLTPKPTNMKVVLLQAATCGVINIATASNVVSYVKTIRDAIEASDYNNNTTKEEMVAIVESIKAQLMQIDYRPQEVARAVSARNPHYVGDIEVMDYHYHNNKSYDVYSEDYLIDKKFSRSNVLTKPRSKDWKINLLGAEGEDLMGTMNSNVSSLRKSSQREESSVIYMSDIIHELEKRGIESVLVFDLSCSLIENRVSVGDIRQVRRSFMRDTMKAKAKLKPKAKSTSTRRTRSNL